MIALIDYGAGNLRSVHKALRYLDADVRLVTQPREMKDARAAVLPGVGAFDDCLEALGRQELLEACRDFIRSGRPFLGICVGYQALFERSEEFNSRAAGLGVFGGKVIRFSEKPELKIDVTPVPANNARSARPSPLRSMNWAGNCRGGP